VKFFKARDVDFQGIRSYVAKLAVDDPAVKFNSIRFIFGLIA
jgi:hypothetical protein